MPHKAMDTSPGTVSLSTDGENYTQLAAGTWSSGDTVYTVQYDGLQYATQYTVIEGPSPRSRFAGEAVLDCFLGAVVQWAEKIQ
ncbi:MAG: hypothetical protein GXX04_07180 [Clostridiaceae bacterium]|nr:hypothetical protein [Clostridiaceae bacterium]